MIKIGVTFAFIFAALFCKTVYGTVMVPPPPPMMMMMPPTSEAMLLEGAQHNQRHINDIVNAIHQTIAQQLVTLSSLARAVASEAFKISKRDILEKTDSLGSTITDSNSKSILIQGIMYNINTNIHSIQQVSRSADGKTDEIKSTMDKINRKIDVIGTTSNNIIERIGPIKHSTEVIEKKIDTIRPLLSDTNGKTDLVKRLGNALLATADLIEQKIIFL